MKFKIGSVLVVSGPSQSGKSVFVENIIQNLKMLFDDVPRKIVWHYGECRPVRKLKNVSYIKGIPTKVSEKSLIVIDDLMQECNNSANITNLFTRIAHHKNCFIIFITQNLFQQSSQSRTRNLNTHYLVIFKNPRDLLTVHILQKQMCVEFLVDAYLDATKNSPFSYLLLDFRQETDDNERIRTDIFGNEHIYRKNELINKN